MSKSLNEYHGPGIIKQIPATKRSYRGTNENGGRKIPQGCIGAGLKRPINPPREYGLGANYNDIRVRFSVADNQISLTPEIDTDA